ncbi:MAG: alpha/beta fold hydrolase [Desulfotomaculaceae bacterium]|nr:alpha/beta fold hydrolase [Desulfotomaculaceae bacterium]
MAQYTTFGYREKYDLIDWVNYIEQQAPGQKIGIWGASYGGATSGLALAYEDMDERIDFLILDCPGDHKYLGAHPRAGHHQGAGILMIRKCTNM